MPTESTLQRLRTLLVLFVVAALSAAACTHQQLTPEAKLKQGAAEMRAPITKTMADPVGRDQMIERADRLERDLASYSAEHEVFIDRLHRANRSYDTSPEQIQAMFARFEKVRQTSRAQLLDLHFQILRLTSEEEWKHIAKAEIQMLEAIGALLPGSQEKKGD